MIRRPPRSTPFPSPPLFRSPVARTNPAERHRGLSLLVVERGMEGFRRGRNLDKIGLHSADTAELFFDDVHVPAENLLGEEGMAFRYLTGNLPKERLSIAIAAVAASRAALRDTVRSEEHTSELQSRQ